MTGLFWMLRLLLMLCAVAALGWLGLRLWMDQKLYPRRRRLRRGPEGLQPPVEECWIPTEDGLKLHAWWQPRAEARGVLLLCHGNAGNLASRRWMLEDLAAWSFCHVLLFDYRGYGKSQGWPSEAGTGRDVRAVWAWVGRQNLFPGRETPLVVYGRSLGTAVALQLAEAVPLRGLVLESGFTSVLELARQRFPWLCPERTLRNPYHSLDRIRRVRCPVLVAHSPEDELIPEEMGRRLAAAAPNLRGYVTLHGSHVEAGWREDPAYFAQFEAFVRDVLAE